MTAKKSTKTGKYFNKGGGDFLAGSVWDPGSAGSVGSVIFSRIRIRYIIITDADPDPSNHYRLFNFLFKGTLHFRNNLGLKDSLNPPK